MNPLTALWRKVTYRNQLTDPDPATGLTVIKRGWGARTVYHPAVPLWLEEHRRRVVREGLDEIDRALLDPATLELLAATAARVPSGRLHLAEGSAPHLRTIQVTEAEYQRIAHYVAAFTAKLPAPS